MAQDWVGARLGKYEIRAEIGRGGMGTVYLAHDPLLDRQVAIKVLAPHLVWEQGFVERFLREARAAARLRHANIVTIHDVGQEGNCYYFVMEYLAGQTLSGLMAARIAAGNRLSPAETVSLIRPLADALDYAHRQGLIHRDVKPGNVIVTPGGQPVLGDFGIARAVQETRLTTTGGLVGTPEYMSPEQARGDEVDERTDQYSLGVVAYEMLGGRTPFGGTTPHGVLYKQIYENPPPICQLQPGLPPAIEAVLGRALAKEPAGRYATVTEFAEALGQAITAQPATLIPRPEGKRSKGAVEPRRGKGKGEGEEPARPQPAAPRPGVTPQPPAVPPGGQPEQAPTVLSGSPLGQAPTVLAGSPPGQAPTVLSGAAPAPQPAAPQQPAPVPTPPPPSATPPQGTAPASVSGVGISSAAPPPALASPLRTSEATGGTEGGPGRAQITAPAAKRSGRAGSRGVWIIVALLVLVAAGLAVAIVLLSGGGPGRVAGGATPTLQLVGVEATRPSPASMATPAPQPPQPTPVPARPTQPPAAFTCLDAGGCVDIGPGQPIRIGYLLVVSGPDASLGIDARRGIELALDDRKDVLGHPIELIGQDGQCTAGGGQAGATKLAGDGQLVAVIGTSCSSEARSAIPIMCEAGIPLVSPSNTAVDLTRPDRPPDYHCYLRTAYNDSSQSRVAARFAWEVLKVKTAATIYDDSVYSIGLQQMFADVFQKLGGSIVAQVSVDVQGRGVPQVIDQLAAAKPDLLFYPIFTDAGAAVTRRARGNDSLRDARLMAADALFSPDFLKAAGPPAEGVFLTSSDFGQFGPGYEQFVSMYVARYKEKPVAGFHAYAFDATMIILRAIERAGIAEPNGMLHIPRRALVDALYATQGYQGLTGNLSCNSSGDCADPKIAVFEIANADPAAWSPGVDQSSNPKRIWP